MSKFDCIIIGYKDYSLRERLFAAGGNLAALNYCKHEYIEYEGQYFFYDEFITHLCKDTTNKLYKISEMPYLGLIYLNNYLKNRGVEVECYNSFDIQIDEIKEKVKTNIVPVVAISAVFYTNPIPIIRIIQTIRKISPNSKIVIGGAYMYNKYISSTKEEFADEVKLLNADYYICDPQGEKALYDIICYVSNGCDKEKIKNTVIYEDDKITYQEFQKEYNDINKDIVKIDKIDSNLLFSTLNIRTSRGCPNRCSFCNYPIRNPKLELQTYDNVISQIEKIQQYDQIKNFVFIDDSFNMPLNRFKEICRGMIACNNKKKWYSYFRMSHCDEEAIQLMKASGCGGVFLGIESADDMVLRNMNKKTTVQQYETALALLNKYKIPTFAYMLIGFPGETRETIQKNIDFLNNNNITFYSFNLWFAEVSTPIYKRKEELELVGGQFEWQHYTMNSIEASELMDYMFERIENSIYIPGENFSFWGVPYMIGKGFTFEETKSILSLIQRYKKLCKGSDKSKQAGECIKEIKEILYRNT